LPTGATAAFNPTTVTGAGSSTLTVTTTTGTAAGNATLTITGTSGALSHTTTVTLGVVGFTVSATPGTVSVAAGGSASYTVTVGAINGFSGTVNLSVSGLPTGATGVFSPTAVTGSGSSTLTVTTPTGAAAGSSTLTITGTSGAVTQTGTVTLDVTGAQDFTVSASPSTRTVNPGANTSYTVSVGAVDGFSGAVSLSVSGLPTGVTGLFSPTSVTGAGSSTLTITTTGAVAGSSTLTITGTSGGVSHTTTVNLTITSIVGSSGVISIDFVGQDVPMGASEVAGVVGQPNWNNAMGASSSSPLGLVDGTGAATAATVSWSSNNVWETPIADQAGNARMMKGYLDTGSNTTTTVNVAGLASNASGYNVYVYMDGDNSGATRTGTYQISGAGISTTTISATDASGANFNGTFVQANNSSGNYVVFTVNATAFKLTATPGTSTDANPRAPINGMQIVPN
jgi:hypothetical protein